MKIVIPKKIRQNTNDKVTIFQNGKIRNCTKEEITKILSEISLTKQSFLTDRKNN